MVDFEPGRMTRSRVPWKRSTGLDHRDLDVRLCIERIEIVEVRDSRENRHGDPDPRPGLTLVVAQVDAVLGRQEAEVVENGTTPQSVHPVRSAMIVLPSLKRRDVATEFVDDRPTDPPSLGGREQLPGADHRGDDAAAVDVADENDRDVGGLGKAHVGNVALREG